MSEIDQRIYNLAEALLAPNLLPGRRDRTAFVDDRGRYSFSDLEARTNQIANLLVRLGLRREDRLVICLYDRFEWAAAFLGAVKAGLVPITASTMLTPADYAYLLADSRADAVLVEPDLWPRLAEGVTGQPCLRHILSLGPAEGCLDLGPLADREAVSFEAAPTYADEPAFWQYSSGTTGKPKGVIHVHGSLAKCAELYAKGVLGMTEGDVVYSAARLFFGYGMGNSLGFPLALGASSILRSGRPTPEMVARILTEQKPTIFFGVPTLYASLLASEVLPPREAVALRLCVSAGEALPAEVGRRWREHFGVDIVEGLGSTEMLHIFISQRPGTVTHGNLGRPTPGYEVRLVGENGLPVSKGEVGELHVRGPTSAQGYWAQRDKSRQTFLGEWTRSADKLVEMEDGSYVFAGRSDDMLKVGGIYVSPLEVEAAIVEHPSVLEAAVVACEDDKGLVKPRAHVVLRPGVTADEACAADIQRHVRDRLAPYKYPRWIRFETELPKTATGKIQRFQLRARA